MRWMLIAHVFLSLLCCDAAQAAESIDFNRVIRPILSDSCFQCHGPDAATREADLRLDLRAAATDDRGGYAVIVPGDAQQSELVARIFSDDPDLVMPPPDSDYQLTDEQRSLLKQWIASGADWPSHWAFLTPRRPAIPDVRDRDWPRNAIDHFILARLQREGLAPSPEASRATLIRRVTLDLTGLPPAPEEVDEFLSDQSPRAYEKVVDRLLRSQRFGEHMALMWLDAARYADTDGYQNDGPRYMWRWRDWVIDAYNANLPFDQFTIEQLAGDLLADASLSQKIATGFNRNHRYNSEAGLVLEEFLLENAVDRVDTTATVWMGLTMGCARCHDHKFDAFSQREYYQLLAFFDNISESGRAVKFGNSEPWVVAPTSQQQQKLDRLDARIEDANRTLLEAQAEIAAALADWQRQHDAAEGYPPVVARGLMHHFPFDGSDQRVTIESGQPEFQQGVIGDAASVDGRSQLVLGKAGDVVCQQRSTVAFWLRADDVGQGVILSRQSRNTRRPGLAVEMRDGHLRFFIITRWVAGVGAVETVQRIEPQHWVHVTLTNDGSQSARGMRIFLDGQPVATKILHNTNSNTGGTQTESLLRIGGGVSGPRFRGQVDELRFYNRTLFEDEISLLTVPETIESILQRPPARRTAQHRHALQSWFMQHAAPPRLRELQQKLLDARAARLEYWDTLPTTMVMQESDPERDTYLRVRGVYHQLGEKVQADVPALLPPMPDTFPRNRIRFAQWLVSGQHPLTARVAVNRYWQRYFGTGFVKTSEDFGVQGELPSHPQLLDWLATEFVRIGWDIKAMQKMIVMSATYRQSSQLRDSSVAAHASNRPGRSQSARPNLLLIDPENRLLARGPRLRLPAHVIRDQALAASGLLVERIGGPSVNPYQPANLWAEMSNMKYRQSRGPDLYRRSLYTIWKRTVAPPSMAVLDAADRETCSVRPKRTNTPLQALTLLNETAFVESARRLAERMMRQGGDDPIGFAFQTVTARRPEPAELKLLKHAHQSYLADFRQDTAAAEKLIAVGASKPATQLDAAELAANTALANVLLNLDEVITKE